MKSALSGHPMSCPKIRQRVPQVTRRVKCDCHFPFAPDRYPTPVLHLHTHHPEARMPGPEAPVEAAAEHTARRYALLARKADELRREIEEVRTALLGFLRASPDRVVVCDAGRYVLRESGGVEEVIWEPKEATPAEASTAHTGELAARQAGS